MNSSASSFSARHFMWAFCLAIVASLTFPFIAEKVPVLRQMSETHWTPTLDGAYQMQGVNADVVIFGDSSALFGPNTVRISQILGLKVVNIPQSMGALALTRERPVWRYLEGNKAPKLMVFHTAPWNQDATFAKDAFFYEGTEQVVRNGQLQDWLHAWRTNPWEMMQFPFRYWLADSKLDRLWSSDYGHYSVARPIQGHADSPYTTPHLEAPCTFSAKRLGSTNADSAEHFIHDFTTSQTKVLVYIAPVPNCTNLKELFAMKHGNLTLPNPLVLPPQDFDNMTYSHPYADTTEVRAQALAQAIRQALAK